MKMEIEIGDDVIPEGWRLVRVGFVKAGERAAVRKGEWFTASYDDDSEVYLVIEREPPPEVPGWFARNEDDDRLLLFAGEPEKQTGREGGSWWAHISGHICEIDERNPLFAIKPLLKPGQKIKASDLLKVQVQE